MAWIKLSHGISSPFGLTIYRTIDIYGAPVKGRGRRPGERERERVVKEVRRIGENLFGNLKVQWKYTKGLIIYI